ncbi:hypothetical protein T06_4531 [Trichinella sp. T6]|nr:hypothetical protein T06_4531 [Trichinella sp. T6]
MTVDCLFGSAASQIIIRDYMADALIRQVETVIPYPASPSLGYEGVYSAEIIGEWCRPSQSILQVEKSPGSRDEPVSGCRNNIRMFCRWSGGATLNPFIDCWCFICYAQCHILLNLKSFQKPLFINNRCYATVPVCRLVERGESLRKIDESFAVVLSTVSDIHRSWRQLTDFMSHCARFSNIQVIPPETCTSPTTRPGWQRKFKSRHGILLKIH